MSYYLATILLVELMSCISKDQNYCLFVFSSNDVPVGPYTSQASADGLKTISKDLKFDCMVDVAHNFN